MAGRLLSNLGLRSRARSPAYQDLPDFEARDSQEHAPAQKGLVSLLAYRFMRSARWSILVLFVIIGLAYLFTGHISSAASVFPAWGMKSEAIDSSKLHKLKVPVYKDPAGGNRRLRIFMPADTPHINLCKSILSAVGLGYPLPTLLNWKGEFNRPEWHFAGSHIAKLESLLAVIEALLEGADDGADVSEDDLAILVDAYDIWFQLPPSVLIQRFHDLNKQADDRVRDQWRSLVPQGVADFPIPPPRQSIIVTTAKDCEPGSESGSNPHYEHWPQSPMPADMYGNDTDKLLNTWDPARKYRRIRPRCVNSGMIMGTMGALRDSLQRAKQKIEAVALSGRQLWSDQALYAEVIGDQELWREWMRSLASTWDGSAASHTPGNMSSEVRSIANAALLGARFEYGIGLDYNFTTIPATCSSEEDGYFVKLNDARDVAKQSTKAGVPGDPRVSGIPHELIKSVSHSDVLKEVAWGYVPLYTDFFFGVTPVGIHHNAYVGGLKSWRLKHWWDRTWFYPRLRELVTAHLEALEQDDEPRPLVELDEGGHKAAYFAPLADRRAKKVTVFEPADKSRSARFEPIHWDGVCQKGSTPWYDELFDDDEGPLQVYDESRHR
ncbi:hypothetical protein S40288_05850 [Stachybotrys chartarum IBT 40288]|nr:hypothetical protein S40288_05850 [Stachybotrys chartarum IBT 40288]